MSEADLSGAALSDTNSSRANLSRAELSFADLKGANLEQVAVSGARFYEAGLRGIPWLIVMELMQQPGSTFTTFQWKHFMDKSLIAHIQRAFDLRCHTRSRNCSVVGARRAVPCLGLCAIIPPMSTTPAVQDLPQPAKSNRVVVVSPMPPEKSAYALARFPFPGARAVHLQDMRTTPFRSTRPRRCRNTRGPSSPSRPECCGSQPVPADGRTPPTR